MQCAAYWNPQPSRGDTTSHFYAKHCTSQVLPYSLTDYVTERDSLFAPVRLAGHQIGIQLCHDQSFGLISEKLVRAGADVLFDLTGSSVVESKWRNVIAARSLEYRLPFFCTMSREETGNANKAFATAYRDGCQIEPERTSSKKRVGDLVLLDGGGPTRPMGAHQAFSASEGGDLTIALHPSTTIGRAVLSVGLEGISGLQFDRWHDWKDLGMLVLPAAKLRDPLCIHRHESGPRSSSRNIVCFVSDADDLSTDEAIVLARLRALEHRVAVVVCTPSVREVIKTSRYKNIQRVPERDGLFRLDGEFMKGTYASMAATSPNGIPDEHQPAYRRLVDEL